MRNGFLSINSVEFANSDEDNKILTKYGNTLYEDDMRFLKARINYALLPFLPPELPKQKTN